MNSGKSKNSEANHYAAKQGQAGNGLQQEIHDSAKVLMIKDEWLDKIDQQG